MARSMQFLVVLLLVSVWAANGARSSGASDGSGGASKKGGRTRKNGTGYVNQNNQVVCLSGGIPVCATDNSENYYFENECFFNAYNAKKSQYGSISALTKIESSNCLKNCDYIYCDASYEPVCGFQPSTGTKQTFTNKCELNRATCFTMSQWVIQNVGPCQQAYNTASNYQQSSQSSQSSKMKQGSKKTSSSSSSYASPSTKYGQPSQNSNQSPMSYKAPMSPSKTYGASPSYSAPSAQVKIPQQAYQSPASYVPKPTYSRPSSAYSAPSQSQQKPYMSPVAQSTQMTSSLSSSYVSPAASSSYSVQSPQSPYMSPMALGTQMTSSPSSPYASPAASLPYMAQSSQTTYQSKAKTYASPSANYGSSSPAASYSSSISTGSYPAATSSSSNSYGATSSSYTPSTATMNTTCPLGNNTVCASMNGVNQTFADPCAVIAASYADGSYGNYETWVVIAQGECENATEICDLGNNTVCASLGGTNQTFANPCGVRDANYEIVNGNAEDSYSSYSVGSYGSYETWIVIAQGECENATVVCELGNNTVCASLGGTNQTFANPCEVRDANNLLANGNAVTGYSYDSYSSYSADSYGSNDTWIVLAQGECEVAPVPCILGNNAVCAERNGTTQTFANPCEVETANANITDGTLWIVIQQGTCGDDVTTTEEITTTTEVTTTEEITTTTEVTTTEEITTTTEVTTTEEVTTTTEVTTTEEATTTTEATTTEEATTTTEATTTEEATTEEATTTEDPAAGGAAGISVQVNIRPRRQLPDFSGFFEGLSNLMPSFITNLFNMQAPSLQPDSIVSSLMNTAMDFPPEFPQISLPSFFGSPIEQQEPTTAPAMSWWEIKASTRQTSTTPTPTTPTTPSTPAPTTPSTPAPTTPATTASTVAPASATNTMDMSNFMANFNQVLTRLSSLIELSSSSSTQTPSTTTQAPPTTTTSTTAAPMPFVFVSGDQTSDLLRRLQGIASPVADSTATTSTQASSTDCTTTKATSAATTTATPAATSTTPTVRQPSIADAAAPVDISQNMITLPSKTNSNVRIVLHLPK